MALNDDPGLIAFHLRAEVPGLLELPWGVPLAEWIGACPQRVELQRGVSRHEVEFVSLDAVIHAVKEMPPELAAREYDLLARLEERRLPVVSPVGYGRARSAAGIETGILVTRFLEGSLPFRTLFQPGGLERYRDRLLDAMAGLMVRLHLAGCYWGDCSLSNALFRRDAGELAAYLVDAETSEVHDTLSDGQRRQDLEIMEENVVGELLDVAASAGLAAPARAWETGAAIRRRYDALWEETRREETIARGDTWRIQERIRALNGLGFSVGEVELVATSDGNRLRVRTIVTDRDYHRHQLHDLTGLVAQEEQARLMLNEIRELKATLGRKLNRSLPLSMAAFSWQRQRYAPAITRLSPLVGRRGDAVELYCEVLEHKWFLSEAARHDVGLKRALADYLARFGAGPTQAGP